MRLLFDSIFGVESEFLRLDFDSATASELWLILSSIAVVAVVGSELEKFQLALFSVSRFINGSWIA